jgi:hypothetical protein
MDVAVESRMAQGKKRCMIQADDSGQDEFRRRKFWPATKASKTTLKKLRASGVNLVGAVMNSDVVYSYLVSGSWMFLVGWVLLLVLAFFAVFHHET